MDSSWPGIFKCNMLLWLILLDNVDIFSAVGFSDTADSLQQADLPIITKEDCIAKQSYDRYYHLVNDNMICAGYKEGGIDACSVSVPYSSCYCLNSF